MRGVELTKSIRAQREAHPDSVFIKWWRNEEDFIDFDLVAHFLENLDLRTDIAGFELIDREEMWRTVESRSKGKASRVQKDGKWVILWDPPRDAEVERLREYPYDPETLLKILDVETNYNYID